MDTKKLAEQIYSEVFGHLDDKDFRAKKTQEIQEWLNNGSLDSSETIEQLAYEWQVYDN